MSNGNESPQSHTEKRQDPKCSLCVNHMGKDKAPRTLGHKGQCKYADCACEKCKITLKRRKGTAIEQQQRRNPEKRPRIEDRDPEPVIDAVKPKLEELIKRIYEFHAGNLMMVTQELEGLLDTCIKTFTRNDEDQQEIQELSENDEDMQLQPIIQKLSTNCQYLQTENPQEIQELSNVENLHPIEESMEKSCNIDYNQNVLEYPNALTVYPIQQNNPIQIYDCGYQNSDIHVVPSEFTYIINNPSYFHQNPQ